MKKINRPQKKLIFQEAKSSTFHTLEKVIKGFSNHRRMEILFLLESRPGMSVADISEELNINFKTLSVHIQRLATAELIFKRNDGNMVRHTLTTRGVSVLKFLRILE